MLRGISPLLSPSLLEALAAMGHTEEITLADANFPVTSYARRVISAPGLPIPPLLDAILSLFPLDAYVEHPVICMAREPGDTIDVPAWEQYERVLAQRDERGAATITYLDKWTFYQRTRDHSLAVVATGEVSPYANVILRKGVV